MSTNKSEEVKQLSHFELVGEFHDTFGHPQRTEPFVTMFKSDDGMKLINFRCSLMEEELKEFETAYKNKDLVEMADALCDLSYVTNGAGHCIGLNLDQTMKQKNINIDTPSGLKPITTFTEETTDNINFCVLLLDVLIKQFKCSACVMTVQYDNEVPSDKFNKLGETLAEIQEIVYYLGHSLGFDMDKMFREVHRSNMTKVCSNMDDANESVKIYEKEGRYKKPSIKTKGKYYVVYDAETSKILKNYKWENPNLKQFF